MKIIEMSKENVLHGKYSDINKQSFLGGKIRLNKTQIINFIDELLAINDLIGLKHKLALLKDNLLFINRSALGLQDIDDYSDTIEVNQCYILNEITQIENVMTVERARYYLKRLKKALTEVKTNKINDINLNRWKEYDEIITDSLWIFNRRDSAGAHLAWYWGNFVPQIPHQLMLRYTKKNEWVLDPFVGSGTTLIECRRLGRNGIGIEINPEVVRRARQLIESESNKFNVITEIIEGNSQIIDIKEILEKKDLDSVQMVIMHPPYHDIINFSDLRDDLSNAENINDFLTMFGRVLDNISPVLDRGRYLAVVIGDKYYRGEWIPLGFYIMNVVLKRDYRLKSIVVKNFEETRAKRRQKELWRYRALMGGFYVFKHEYIFIFNKKGSSG